MTETMCDILGVKTAICQSDGDCSAFLYDAMDGEVSDVLHGLTPKEVYLRAKSYIRQGIREQNIRDSVA